MSKAWKITLADGSTIDGLDLNGNNFVSQSEITPDVFAGKLSRVKIEGPANDDTHSGTGDAGLMGDHGPMELVQIQRYNNPGAGLIGWYFVLRDVQVTDMERLRGDVEYLAMMAGVDL